MVVKTTLLYNGGTPTPPDNKTFVVAISANLLNVVAPDAYIKSPVVYVVRLVPPFATGKIPVIDVIKFTFP